MYFKYLPENLELAKKRLLDCFFAKFCTSVLEKISSDLSSSFQGQLIVGLAALMKRVWFLILTVKYVFVNSSSGLLFALALHSSDFGQV